jgi:hypothetical protein
MEAYGPDPNSFIDDIFNPSHFQFLSEPVSYQTLRDTAVTNIAGSTSYIKSQEVNLAGVVVQSGNLEVNTNIVGNSNTLISGGFLQVPNISTDATNLVITASNSNNIYIGLNDGQGDIYMNTDTSSNLYIDGGDLVMNNINQKLRMGTSELYFNDNAKWNTTELKVGKLNINNVDLEGKLTTVSTDIIQNKQDSDSHFTLVETVAETNKTQLQGSITTLNTTLTENINSVNTTLTQQINNNQTATNTRFGLTDNAIAANKTAIESTVALLDTKVDTNKSAIDASFNLLAQAKADITYVDGKVSQLVNGAPELLNSLNELATAIGNDNNFSTTVANLIGTKTNQTYTDEQIGILNSNIETRALSSYVNTELGKKVNYTDYSNYQSQVAASLLTKTNQTDFTSTTTDLQSQINAKASTTYLNEQLDLKANTTQLTSQVATLQTDINSRALNTYVNDQLSLKTNITDFQSGVSNLTGLINEKASSTYVSGALALKADKSYVDSQVGTLEGSIALKSDISYVDSAIQTLIGAAPTTLDTLQEISTAIAEDANFSVTIVNSIASKTSKTYVDGEVASLQTQIDARATTSSVATALSSKSDLSFVNTQLGLKADIADLTSLSSVVSTLPTTSYVASQITSANNYTDSSIIGLASTSYVDTKAQTVKSEILGGVGPAYDTLLELQTALSNNADAVTALTNSVSAKASSSELSAAVSNLQTAINAKASASDITTALTGYATESYVSTAISNIPPNTTDLTGYATTTYVDNAVSNVSVDLTGYATETYVSTAVTGLASQTYVANAVATAKNDILGGAGAAYDTLSELNALIQAGDSSVSTSLATQISSKADDSTVVHKTGAETISGVKTFNSNIIVPSINSITSATLAYLDATSSVQTQLNAKVGAATSNSFTNSNNFQQISETLLTYGNIVSNIISVSYLNGLIYQVTPVNTTNNTLAITNLPTGTNKSYTFTVMFDTSTYKAYINAVSVNGGAGIVPKYINGSTTVNASSNIMVQSISIIFNSSSSTVPFRILSSVASFY